MNKTFIKSKIIRLCNQPRTFDFLCKNMDGLDPIKLMQALKDLEDSLVLQKKEHLWVKKEPPSDPTLGFVSEDSLLYLKKYMGHFEFLKTPHPLDFEWRNSTASLDYLTDIVQQLNSVNDSILYLGMPTLFATAIVKDIPHKITLVERNKPIVEGLSRLSGPNKRFHIREADIFHVIPSKIGKHHCVIMDPPWYSPIFKQFMWLAAQSVEVGGVVGISMPPINTKDDILDERMEWIRYCNSHGLCLEKLMPQQLHYAMPFFEFNALRSAGVTGFSPFWRKGDLALFRKISERTTDRPAVDIAVTDWNEIEIENVRIRVNFESRETKLGLHIEHIVKGDILPSVSKSDTRRKSANIWTSGNRVFKVNDPENFFKLLGEVKEGRKYHNKNEQIVVDFVEQITSLEKKEYVEYLQWLYDAMEKQIA